MKNDTEHEDKVVCNFAQNKIESHLKGLTLEVAIEENHSR